jgi:hypothetical protein
MADRVTVSGPEILNGMSCFRGTRVLFKNSIHYIEGGHTLGECVPVDLRNHVPEPEVHSVIWAGFSGLKNGRLLRAAEVNGYQALLTVRVGRPHQQNIAQTKIAVIVVRSRSHQLEDIWSLLHKISAVLADLKLGSINIIT